MSNTTSLESHKSNTCQYSEPSIVKQRPFSGSLHRCHNTKRIPVIKILCIIESVIYSITLTTELRLQLLCLNTCYLNEMSKPANSTQAKPCVAHALPLSSTNPKHVTDGWLLLQYSAHANVQSKLRQTHLQVKRREKKEIP